MGRTHYFAVRAYFEDTDVSGVVYHANFLRFMERARSDMLRCVGVDQRAAMEAGEGAYAIADIAIRFRAPARLNDELLVVSHVRKVLPASCTLQQQVMRDDLVLTDATVLAAFVAPDGRPRRQPREWIDIYKPLVERADVER